MILLVLIALCWIRQGHRPERDEIPSPYLKFLWGHFECLVVQDRLLYKQEGPLCGLFKFGHSLLEPLEQQSSQTEVQLLCLPHPRTAVCQWRGFPCLPPHQHSPWVQQPLSAGTSSNFWMRYRTLPPPPWRLSQSLNWAPWALGSPFLDTCLELQVSSPSCQEPRLHPTSFATSEVKLIPFHAGAELSMFWAALKSAPWQVATGMVELALPSASPQPHSDSSSTQRDLHLEETDISLILPWGGVMLMLEWTFCDVTKMLPRTLASLAFFLYLCVCSTSVEMGFQQIERSPNGCCVDCNYYMVQNYNCQLNVLGQLWNSAVIELWFENAQQGEALGSSC